MKKTLSFLSSHKKECVLGPLFKLIEASFELMVPLVVASIIDKGILKGDTRVIYSGCITLALFAFIGLLLAITAQYFSAKAAVGFGTKIRHALFDKIQSLSFTELDRTGTSTLITGMTGDINQVQTTINLVLRLFLRSPFIVIGAMIMAFTIDFRAALIFAGVIPVLCAVVFGIMLGTVPLYKKVQSALDKITTLTIENLEGTRVIRAFCSEDKETESYADVNSKLNHLQRFAGKISALLNPATYIIINMAIILLIYTGSIRINVGDLSQGDLVALYNYMSQILVELIKLATFIISINKAIACSGRIEAVFDMESSVKDGTGIESASNNTAVEFDGVSLTYSGAGEASLEDITFTVNKGDTIGIIGSTGSGKSSLVNLIPRFYDATKGSVKINGIDVKAYKIDDLRNKIGIAMQKSVLFKGTIKENILRSKPDASDEQIKEAIAMAQASDVISSKKLGLDEMIEQGGTNLSGGQKQRLSIARALVRKPEILILDDSSSALDYATDAALRNAIKGLSYSPTVFVVSQRTASVRHADKIIVLEDGKICGIGTHDELLASCEVYREIHQSQE